MNKFNTARDLKKYLDGLSEADLNAEIKVSVSSSYREPPLHSVSISTRTYDLDCKPREGKFLVLHSASM